MGKEIDVQDKRAQLRDLVAMQQVDNRYGASTRSPRQVRAKRKKIKRELERATRDESRLSFWLKMTFGSSFIILALFSIPVAVGLLIMLATIPEVIREIDVIPQTIAVVSAISLGLLFAQSGLISTVLVVVFGVRHLRTGTIITFVVSMVTICIMLSFLAPVFQFRGIY